MRRRVFSAFFIWVGRDRFDGRVLIYAREVAQNDLGRNNENQKSERSNVNDGEKGESRKSSSVRLVGDGREIHGDTRSDDGRDGILSERGESNQVEAEENSIAE